MHGIIPSLPNIAKKIMISCILLCPLLLGTIFASSVSGCATSSSSSTMKVVQTISGPIESFDVAIISPDLCTTSSQDVFNLPRFTWTLEPAPEGANETTVMMSPPDLGTLLYDPAYGSGLEVTGIQINPALNLTNGSEVGIAVQIPRDELKIVDIPGGSAFYVNIVDGFTDIIAVMSGFTYDAFKCSDGVYQHGIAGRGTMVNADLSSAFMFSSLTIEDSGAEWKVKLAVVTVENFDLRIDVTDARIMVQGDFDCTRSSSCWINAWTSERCGVDCATELTFDGRIGGKISTRSGVVSPEHPYGEENAENEAIVITTNDPNGCDRFGSDLGTPPDCTFDADVKVDFEGFPCTVTVKEEGDPMDILECHGDQYQKGSCLCTVPGECQTPSPSPTRNPSSSSLLVKPAAVLPFVAVAVTTNLIHFLFG